MSGTAASFGHRDLRETTDGQRHCFCFTPTEWHFLWRGAAVSWFWSRVCWGQYFCCVLGHVGALGLGPDVSLQGVSRGAQVTVLGSVGEAGAQALDTAGSRSSQRNVTRASSPYPTLVLWTSRVVAPCFSRQEPGRLFLCEPDAFSFGPLRG